jgi:hypothetical protein
MKQPMKIEGARGYYCIATHTVHGTNAARTEVDIAIEFGILLKE